MGYIILYCVLLIVQTALAKDQSSLIFTNDEIIVNINQKVHLDCGVKGTYRYCAWGHGDELLATNLIHDNIYSGMSKPENIEDNQCGIVLDNATTETHGEWTCKVFTNEGLLIAKKNVTITVKPKNAKISSDKLLANAFEETKFECSVEDARPAAKIRWFLDDEDITENSEAKYIPFTYDGTLKTVSKISRTFTPIENGEVISCVVDHPSLDKSDILVAPVNVLYVPLNVTQTFSVFNESDDKEVRITFLANPMPSKIVLQYGDQFDNLTYEVEIPSEDEKMVAELESGVDGNFTIILNISNFSEDDFQRKYNLLVENDIGSTNYHVILSRYIENITSNHLLLPSNDTPVVMAVVITSSIVLAFIGLVTSIVQKGSAWGKCLCSKNKKAESDVEYGTPIIINTKEDEDAKITQAKLIANEIENKNPKEKEDENGNEDVIYGLGQIVGTIV